MDWAHRYFEQGYAQRWSLGPPTLETERDVDALWNHLRMTPGAPVLDVGCGNGRLAIALAKRGADVTGLDFSTTLTARAVEMSGALGVTARWVRADMRALPLRAGTFLAAVLFDTFGFFESDDENHVVLRELARVLVPVGRVALKVANAVAIVARFRSSERDVNGERTLEIQRSLASDPPRLIEDIVIRGPERIDRYQRRQRLYRLDEVFTALENAGFVLIDMAATIGGAPFDPSTSPSMVIVAERRP
jgi:SAM-dependent methyltransferase